MRKRGSALGSSSSTEGPFPVARLGKPNGLDGFLGLYVDEGDLAYFEPGAVVHVAGRPLTVRESRRGAKGPQVAFVEVTDRDGAEAIRGNDVFVDTHRELDEEEFWNTDLVGLAVRPGGGVIVAVERGPAQDRLVVEREGVRFEVPFVHEIVPVVDVLGGFVEIREIPGLSLP